MPKNAQRTRFVWVFQVESQGVRRYEGRADVCYYYTLTISGRKKWIKVGWKSEGYTATTAQDLRMSHIQAARHGTALPERRDRGKNGLTLNHPSVGPLVELLPRQTVKVFRIVLAAFGNILINAASDTDRITALPRHIAAVRV